MRRGYLVLLLVFFIYNPVKTILQFERLNKIVSFLDYPCYLAIGMHHIDACRQMRDIDTRSVGSVGYFRAVCVVYMYTVYGFVGSYIQNVFDGVRIYAECR